MFGKKYIVYTPDTNYGISNNGEYLMNGECSYKFKSMEKAIELISYICKDGDGRFTLVEKDLISQKLINYKVNNDIKEFDGIRREQGSSKIIFKGTKLTMGWTGTLISEEFTDMKSYYCMSLALPVLKQHIIHYLDEYNYKINTIDLQIVKKAFGWVYELNLNISFNLDTFVKMDVQSIFNENLYFGDIGNVYNCDGKYKQNKNFYSYYNVACGLALEEPSKTITTLNFKGVDEFYNNCIAKDWEVI